MTKDTAYLFPNQRFATLAVWDIVGCRLRLKLQVRRMPSWNQISLEKPKVKDKENLPAAQNIQCEQLKKGRKLTLLENDNPAL